MRNSNDGPIDAPVEQPPIVKYCGEDGLTPAEYEQMEQDAFDSGEPTMTNDGNYPSESKEETDDEED
jgi:hypothetical protein